jgi:hypothetical protein
MKVEANVVEGGFNPRPPLLERHSGPFQRRHAVVALVADLVQTDQLKVVGALLHLIDARVEVVVPVPVRHRRLRESDTESLQR